MENNLANNNNGWTETWKGNGFEKAGGGKITDYAGWEELLVECGRHIVEVVYSDHHGKTEKLEDIIRRGGVNTIGT